MGKTARVRGRVGYFFMRKKPKFSMSKKPQNPFLVALDSSGVTLFTETTANNGGTKMNAAEKKFEELKDLLGTSLDAILLCKEKLIERNHDEIYAELLDEIYGEVSICGLTYSAGYALRECDPVAFRCGLHDYLAENAIELGDCHFYDWQIEELIEETKTDMEFGHFKRDTDRHGYA